MSRQEIIARYTNVLTRVDQEARAAPSYGGHLRKVKGSLQEELTESILRLAWEEAGGSANRLSIGDRKTYRVHVRPEYVAKQPDELRTYIESRLDDHFYRAQVDKHVFIGGQLVLGIECKAYAENAMLKRILLDFNILKTRHPDLVCCLLQLESMLGGDYSNPLATRFGSPSSHALMSLFPDVQLHIVTLLEGERHPNRPIHRLEFFKEMRVECLDLGIRQVRALLQPFV